MYKAIAIIITVATFGATAYFLSRGSSTGQTAIVSADSQTAEQTNTATGKGNQYRYGQQNTVKPNPSTSTQTS